MAGESAMTVKHEYNINTMEIAASFPFAVESSFNIACTYLSIVSLDSSLTAAGCH